MNIRDSIDGKIKQATLQDLPLVSELLLAMYMELYDSTELKLQEFTNLAKQHILESVVLIYEEKAFFIMQDKTPCVLRTKMWSGISVYIKPQYRHSRILKELYEFMFSNFEGTIMGYTEVNSAHNKVLLKRHKLLGFVYELNRPEE